jgi:arylsulfatase A-like enzyme
MGQTPERRPNILFALADDWGWPFASIAGEPVVRTPVFDRVARNGVLFTNAFVSAPSCSPSRAAILTGQWHWRLEEGANLGGTLAAKIPVYPDLLESAGYHVGFTRKGWSPGDPAPGGRNRNPAGPRYQDFAEFLAGRP